MTPSFSSLLSNCFGCLSQISLFNLEKLRIKLLECWEGNKNRKLTPNHFPVLPCGKILIILHKMIDYPQIIS